MRCPILLRRGRRKLESAQDGNADFPIVRDNLGKRVGITGEGAGLLRSKFARLGVIKLTVPHKPNVAAARFCWLLGESVVEWPL